jgi:hypothetical protein
MAIVKSSIGLFDLSISLHLASRGYHAALLAAPPWQPELETCYCQAASSMASISLVKAILCSLGTSALNTPIDQQFCMEKLSIAIFGLF